MLEDELQRSQERYYEVLVHIWRKRKAKSFENGNRINLRILLYVKQVETQLIQKHESTSGQIMGSYECSLV